MNMRDVAMQYIHEEDIDEARHPQRAANTLPSHWKTATLGEIAKVLYGKARPNDSPNDNGTFSVIGSGGIYGSTSRPLIEYETLVIGRKGAAGSVYYAPKPCYPSDTAFYLEWKQEICVQFLYYSLQLRGLAPDKSVIPSLQRGDIENFIVALPPLPEQRAIAHALQTVQDAIQACRNEIELERARKAALMQRLFTHGACNSTHSLKETRFGHIPMYWDVQQLEYCAFIQTGVTKGRKLEGKHVITLPYLRVANVQDGYLDLSEIKSIELLESEAESYKLHPGDVVVTEGGDFDKLGRGFLWHGQIPNCVHQNHIFAVRANRNVLLPEYLAYLIQSNYGKAYFLSVAHKTTNLASINSTKLKAFPALIPPLDEQKDIASTLQACDSRIASLEKELSLHEELFRALLDELMTGQLSALPLVE